MASLTRTVSVEILINGVPAKDVDVIRLGDVITARINGGEPREVGRIVPPEPDDLP